VIVRVERSCLCMYVTTLHISVAKAFRRNKCHMLLLATPGMLMPRESESEWTVWTVLAQGSWINIMSALHVWSKE
jgi:hypothetical protein